MPFGSSQFSFLRPLKGIRASSALSLTFAVKNAAVICVAHINYTLNIQAMITNRSINSSIVLLGMLVVAELVLDIALKPVVATDHHQLLPPRNVKLDTFRKLVPFLITNR